MRKEKKNQVQDTLDKILQISYPYIRSGICYRDVLFEFHLKFWNTASIGIPARSLGRQTGLTAQQKGTTA